ncbi:hypothetical protein D3C71_1350050 [compost metagenome]
MEEPIFIAAELPAKTAVLPASVRLIVRVKPVLLMKSGSVAAGISTLNPLPFRRSAFSDFFNCSAWAGVREITTWLYLLKLTSLRSRIEVLSFAFWIEFASAVSKMLNTAEGLPPAGSAVSTSFPDFEEGPGVGALVAVGTYESIDGVGVGVAVGDSVGVGVGVGVSGVLTVTLTVLKPDGIVDVVASFQICTSYSSRE